MLRIDISISLEPNGIPKVMAEFSDPNTKLSENHQITNWAHLAELSQGTQDDGAETYWDPGVEDWCLINWGLRPEVK